MCYFYKLLFYYYCMTEWRLVCYNSCVLKKTLFDDFSYQLEWGLQPFSSVFMSGAPSSALEKMKISIWHWHTFVVVVCKSSTMKAEAVWCANASTIAVLLIVLPKDLQNFIKEQRCGIRSIFEEAKWDKTSKLLCVRLSSNVWRAPAY